jgi:hypothetical protein
MSNKIVKIKMFFSFEKEEAWLAQMSAAGWHLAGNPNGFYTFIKGEPEQRVYKIDFRKFNHKQDMIDYVTLFEDSGWRSIDPRLSRYNYYFYSRSDGAEKDIFSDKASKAQRYLRYAQYLGYSFFPILMMYFVLYASGTLRVGDFGYLTPGLWEMTGWQFAARFLFETPFVLMRATCGFLPMVILLAGFYYVLRFFAQYRRALADDGITMNEQ